MRWELPTLDPSQLPPLPPLGGDGLEVDGIGDLVAACDRFRASDEGKPMLCCAALYPEGPGCVATNSYAIMVAGKCEGEMVLMPPAMAAAARSMESARVGGDESVSWIEGGGVALTFRAVSGQYPPWRKLMADLPAAATFPAAAMAAAAKCATAATDRQAQHARMWADGQVRLEVRGGKTSFDCSVGGSGTAPEVGIEPAHARRRRGRDGGRGRVGARPRQQVRHALRRRAPLRDHGSEAGAVRYISLFSGIEAASVAWGPLGWEPVAFAEIEKFPSAVLAERFPQVPNLGDVAQVDWSGYCGAVDVVVGGSPCQAFSIAGNRRGLMDERGLLMLEYCRAVGEVRPRWVVWENVPGVLSQDSGLAFGTLLGELEERGYSLAWRVLDAQYFGVAQRRRRVFLVGHLGAGGERLRRYSLSRTACEGMIRRAGRRGKSLPPQLAEALEAATRSS